MAASTRAHDDPNHSPEKIPAHHMLYEDGFYSGRQTMLLFGGMGLGFLVLLVMAGSRFFQALYPHPVIHAAHQDDEQIDHAVGHGPVDLPRGGHVGHRLHAIEAATAGCDGPRENDREGRAGRHAPE